MTTNRNENARMKLYGYPNSRATRALWALEEAQAEYDYVHVDVKAGAGKDQNYRAINPGGKVPTLVDGDLVITESAAICLYVGEKYPQYSLPRSVRIRSKSIPNSSYQGNTRSLSMSAAVMACLRS